MNVLSLLGIQADRQPRETNYSVSWKQYARPEEEEEGEGEREEDVGGGGGGDKERKE